MARGWAAGAGRLPVGLQRSMATRYAVPVVMVVPALAAVIALAVARTAIASPLLLDFLMAGVTIAIVAALARWSIARIAAEHAAQWDASYARATTPIALTTLSGTIRQWSHGCETLYGWSAAEAVGRCKYDLLQSRDAASGNALRAEDGAPDGERELIERRSDGTDLHVIAQGRRIDVAGQALVLQTMTDISARVRIAAALRESEATLALALEAHRIGTFEWEVQTGRVAVSVGTEQRLGLQPGALNTFQAWAERVDPRDLATMAATVADAQLRQVERFGFELRIRGAGESVRAFEGSGRLVFDRAGGLVKIVGMNIDVTDRNARDAALIEQQEQFRSVLQTVPSAMVIIDEAGTIKAFSASAEAMFGYSAAEAVGSNVSTLTPDAIRDTNDSFITRNLRTGEMLVTVGPRMIEAQRRDGSIVPIELWTGEIQVGTTRLFTGFCKDLTERLAAEERLGDMQQELLHVSRLSAMGELAAGLAHELNQPLAATVYLLGAADHVLSEDAGRAQGRELVRLASAQALRAGEIIRRMRDFATKEDVELQVEPIGSIIEDAVAIAFLGARFDIQLRYELDPAAASVLADRIQIEQVFVNLLRNAIDELRKCPPVGRTITIATHLLDAETVEISVADNGPGLDPMVLDNLYMPFVSTKGEKNMGVGLSICRRIIETHGGTFQAANSTAGGAVFRFTLPNMTVDPSEVLHDDA